MTTASTDLAAPRRAVNWGRPASTLRQAIGDFVKTRRRTHDVFHMTRVLSRLNDRQLSALGLRRDRLYVDLEDRYDEADHFVEDILALVDESERQAAITHEKQAA